jgi:hypothetical protein
MTKQQTNKSKYWAKLLNKNPLGDVGVQVWWEEREKNLESVQEIKEDQLLIAKQDL